MAAALKGPHIHPGPFEGLGFENAKIPLICSTQLLIEIAIPSIHSDKVSSIELNKM